MSNKKSVTLKDLAHELGLSVFTVSKALRGLPGMSEETRKAVLDLARIKKYRTKEQDYSLAVDQIPIFTQKPKRFKFISLPNIGFHQFILEGIQETLSGFGHIIEPLFISPASFKLAQFEKWATNHNLTYMDGLFIPPSLHPALEQKLLLLDVPKIMINYPPSNAQVDSVIWDVGAAVSDSVHYLHSMGHRNILYVGDTVKTRGYILRWQAFQETTRELGIPTKSEHHVVGHSEHNQQLIEMISNKIKTLRPTAILCAINYNLAWIFHACSSIGQSIPEHISLVSLELKANDMLPELTRPILLVKETGMRAAERMLWRLANPSSPIEHVRLRGPFYSGKTVRKRTPGLDADA